MRCIRPKVVFRFGLTTIFSAWVVEGCRFMPAQRPAAVQRLCHIGPRRTNTSSASSMLAPRSLVLSRMLTSLAVLLARCIRWAIRAVRGQRT